MIDQKLLKVKIILTILFVMVFPAFSTDYQWNGGPFGDWETGTNWNPNSAAGGPVSGDNVLIDTAAAVVSSSGAVTVSSLILSNSASFVLGGGLVSSGNISVYSTSVLTCGNNSLDISGNLSNSGTLNIAAANIRCSDFTSNGVFTATGTCTITSAGNVSISGTFTHGSSTFLALEGIGNLSSADQLYNVTVTGGTRTLVSGVETAGFVKINSGAVLSVNTRAVSSAGNIENSGTLNISTGSINCAGFTTSGTYTATGSNSITSTSHVTISGTFTHNSSTTLVLDGTINLNTSSPLYALKAKGGISTLSTGITATGSVVVDSGATLDVNSRNIKADGGVVNDGILAISTGSINCAGFTSSGTYTATGSNSLTSTSHVTISGTFTHNSSSNIYINGTANLSSVCPLYNITVLSGVVSPSGNLSLSNNLAVTSGTLDLGTTKVTIGGDFANSGTVTASTGSTVTMSGTGKTLGGGGSTSVDSLIIPGSVSLSGNVYAAGTTISSSGALDLVTRNLTINGSFSCQGALTSSSGSTLVLSGTAKTLSCSGTASVDSLLVTGSITQSGSMTFLKNVIINNGASYNTGGNNLTIGGNISNSGTFSAASGTVVLTGAGKTFGGTGTTGFYNLTLSGAATLSGNISVGGTLNFSAGTINLGGGNYILTLSGSGSPLAGGGTWSPGNSTVRYTGSSNVTITPVSYYSLDFNNAAGTYKLATNLTVNANITVTGGTFDCTGRTVYAGGNWNCTSGNQITAFSTAIFNGSTNQTITANGKIFGNFTVNNLGAPGNVNISADLDITDNLTVNDGTLDLSSNPLISCGGNVLVASGANFTKGSSGVGKMLLYGAGMQTVDFNTSDAGDLEIAGIIELKKDLTADDITIDSGAELYLNGVNNTVTLNINSGKKIANFGTVQIADDAYEVKIKSVSGTADYEGSDITYNGKGVTLSGINYTVSAVLGLGDKIKLGGDCSFKSIIIQDGTFDLSSANVTIGGNVTILSEAVFTKNAGPGKVVFSKPSSTLTLSASNKNLGNVEVAALTTLRISGQLIVDSMTVTGTVQLNGASSPMTLTVTDGGTITNNGTVKVYSNTKTVSIESGSAVFAGTGVNLNGKSLYVKGLTFTADTVVGAFERLYLSGNCTFNNLSVADPNGGLIQGTNNDLNVKGTLSILPSTFTKDAGTGTFIFSKGAPQNVSVYGLDIGRVRVSGSSTSASLLTDICFDSLIIDAGAELKGTTNGISVLIIPGGEITVNGTLALTGAAGNEISLASASAGSSFNLNCALTATVALSAVKIKDCSATGKTVDARQGCINLSGNTNILFGAVTWVGGTSIYYSNPLNWDNNTVPLSDDTVVIAGAVNCNMDVPVTAAWLTIDSSYSGTVTVGQGLKVSETFKIQGGTLNDSGTVITCKGDIERSGGTLSLTGNLVFENSTGTKTLSSGGASFNNIIVAAGASFKLLDLLSVSGDLTCNSGVLDFNGQNAVLAGNLLNNNGSFITGAQTITLSASSGTKTIKTGESGLSKIVFSPAGGTIYTLSGNLLVNSDIKINSGTISAGSNTISIKGNFDNAGSFNAGTGEIVFCKEGTQTFYSGAGVLNRISVKGAGTSLSVSTNIAFKELYIDPSTSFICSTSNVTITVLPAGTITSSSGSTISLNGGSANNEISLISGTPGSSFNLVRNGTVVLAFVKIKDCDASAGSVVDASSNCVNLGGNKNVSFAPVVWTGSADGTFSNPGNWNTNVVPASDDIVVFSSGSALCTVTANAAIGALSVTGYNGTILVASGTNLTVNGAVSVSGGIVSLSSAALIVKGNFTAAPGKFISSSSVLKFEGSGELTTNGNPVNALNVGTSGATITIKDNLRADSIYIESGAKLSCLTPLVQVNVSDGGVITVKGTMEFKGTVDNEITMRPITDGQLFYIVNDGTVELYAVDIKDCDADNGKKIDASNACLDKGRNRNIYFGAATVLAENGADVKYFDDSSTLLKIPAEALSKDARVSLTQLDVSPAPGMGYEIKAVGYSDRQPINEMIKPAELVIHYGTDLGAPKRSGAWSPETDAGSLAIFYYNGVEWVKLGGVVEKTAQTVTVKTAKFGKYKVKVSARATEFTMTKVAPTKVFTPNGDGIWDDVKFYIENPKDSAVTAEIYSLNSEKTADLRLDPTEVYYSWDGKNSSGNIVEGGIYVYQFKCDGKVINGTVVVAK